MIAACVYVSGMAAAIVINGAYMVLWTCSKTAVLEQSLPKKTFAAVV